jgi:cyclohexanone monooxygenase
MWVDTRRVGRTPEEAAELERSDFETMEALRRRVDEQVHDPATAEKLKPWYGKSCKRVCFHDEYLPAFNEPNVHLVDTDGRGVDRITATGVVVGEVEIPLDCLIFASGFEVSTDYHHRLGFDPKGRGGRSLSEVWSQGARTLHGILCDGFPNMLMIGLTQAGFGTNFVHFLARSSEHVAHLVATCQREGIATIEPTTQAEEDWLMVLYRAAAGINPQYFASCTPGYYTSEGAPRDAKSARNLVYPGSLLDYAAHLERWRAAGDLAGTKVTRISPT